MVRDEKIIIICSFRDPVGWLCFIDEILLALDLRTIVPMLKYELHNERTVLVTRMSKRIKQNQCENNDNDTDANCNSYTWQHF